MSDRILWFRFFGLLLIVVLALQLNGCATTDNSKFVKTMSSDTAAVTCQAADAITTYVAIAKVGSIHEANPIMAGIIKAGGWPLFFIVKAVMALWMTSDNINPTVAAAVNTATCGVAVQNAAVITHVLNP